MSLLYIFVTLFIAIFIEFFFGSLGLIIPLSAMAIFYFSVTQGWRSTLFIGALAGLIIDFGYGRSFLLTPFIMGLTVGISILWLYKVKSNSLTLHVIAGAIIAVVYTIPQQIVCSLDMGISLNSLFLDTSILTFTICVSSVLLPLTIIVLDLFSLKLDFNIYSKAKDSLLIKR